MYLQLFDCIMVYDFLLWLPLAFKTEGLRMVDVGSQAVCASDLVTQMFPLLLLGVDLDVFFGVAKSLRILPAHCVWFCVSPQRLLLVSFLSCVC